MIKNNLGESLIGIVIGIMILAFIILGVTNLLINSKTIVGVYNDKKTINILKNNTINILKNIDTSKVKETEIFYIYKDENLKEFKIFTGATNYEYKYIDKNGNKVNDLINFKGNIYSRILRIERNDNSLLDNRQIIKASIKKLIKK